MVRIIVNIKPKIFSGFFFITSSLGGALNDKKLLFERFWLALHPDAVRHNIFLLAENPLTGSSWPKPEPFGPNLCY
jgi:hypothetical protein